MIVFTTSLLAKTEAYIGSASTGTFYQSIHLGILILNLVSLSLYSPLRYNILIHGFVLKIKLMLWSLM